MNRVFALILTVVLLAATCGLGLACRAKEGQASKTLRVGMSHAANAALIFTAEQEGIFAKEGIEVATVVYPDSPSVLAAWQNGHVDAAVLVDLTLTSACMELEDLKIVAVVSVADQDNAIVARKSPGLTRANDLVGKKVGTTRMNSTHFFLNLFLLRHDIEPSQIDVEYGNPQALLQSLEAGELDAASLFGPSIALAQNQLADQAMTFDLQDFYSKPFTLVTSSQVLSQKEKTMQAFVRALIAAEKVHWQNPKQAMQHTAAALGLQPEDIESTFAGFHHEVFLDQSLIMTMEAQARWLIYQEGLYPEPVPDFLDRIHPDILNQVAPERMRIAMPREEAP